MLSDRYRFLKELKEKSYHSTLETGKRYLLTSGMISEEYVDIKTAILDPVVSISILREVNNILRDEKCDVIAGVELGGALLALMVAHSHTVPCLVIRKDDRTHGVTKYGIDGLGNIDSPEYSYSDNDVRHVWLIEDVITTGDSVIKALERFCYFDRFKIEGVIAVVDRQQSGIDKIKEKFKGLSVIALTTLREIRSII